MDIGTIAYTYIWLGFVKLMMALYSIGGLAFAIGFVFGILGVIFFEFAKRLIPWILLIIIIGSIGVGIYASDLTWQEIKEGNWSKATTMTESQYKNVNQKVNQDINKTIQKGIEQVTNFTTEYVPPSTGNWSII